MALLKWEHTNAYSLFLSQVLSIVRRRYIQDVLLSGVPDYFGRNKISSGGDLSHYSSASLY